MLAEKPAPVNSRGEAKVPAVASFRAPGAARFPTGCRGASWVRRGGGGDLAGGALSGGLGDNGGGRFRGQRRFKGVTGVSSVIAHRSEIRPSPIASNIGINGLATIKAKSRDFRNNRSKDWSNINNFRKNENVAGSDLTASNGTTTRTT